jgi:hypothetical protein
VAIIESIIDMTIGFVKNLIFMLLDHLESTEIKRNNDANIVIGINIAL